MIKKVTEEEAHELTKDDHNWTIVIKEENDITESAVCLKKIKIGYLLGVSCDTTNFFELFIATDYEEILKKTHHHIALMKETNYPYKTN